MASDPLSLSGQTLNVFDDIAYAALPTSDPNVFNGQQFLNQVDSFQVGSGSSVLRVDQSGLWLGAASFADAPFSVDMDGNIVATGLSLSSLSGTLDDIANGTTYAKTTTNAAIGAGYAYTGLNSSGEIIQGFLNSQLSSKSLPTNGVRVDANGIYGRQSGSTTFYIDSVGNAYFSGTITAAAMSASTISGTTITGSTLTTATSGQRIVLSSTLAQYYDSTGTKIVETYATSGTFGIFGQVSTSNIYLSAGTSGAIAFLENGTVRVLYDNVNNTFAPFTDGFPDLGGASANWKDFYMSGVHSYQGIDQPIVFWGQASGTSISPDNTSFTMTHPSTGKYTISHGLGHTNFSFVVTAIVGSGAGAYSAKVESFTSSNVKVTIFDDTGTVRDADFMFMMCVDPN